MDSSLIATSNQTKNHRFLAPEKESLTKLPANVGAANASSQDAAPSAIYFHSTHSEQSVYTAKTNNVESIQKPQNGSDIASRNILVFIERQLAFDVADGASQEDLSSRIEAGLSGFKVGFESAKDDLKSLDALDDKLSVEIQQTYDKVLSGIETLKEKYIEGYKSNTDSKSNPSASSASPKVESTQTISALSAHKNEFSFSVTTLEGDVVTLNTSSLKELVSDSFVSSGQSNKFTSIFQSERVENNFLFSVDGELDAGEMKSINKLLHQVNDLAETFFSGGFQAAFEEAMQLGLDSKELSAFSLNLTQTSVQKATSAYQSAGQHDGLSSTKSRSNALQEKLEPLGQYVRDLLESVQTASAFQYPERLISDLAGLFDGAQSKAFKDSLMSLLVGEDSKA
jgi:hypothetical protein